MSPVDVHRLAREGQRNLLRNALEENPSLAWQLDSDSRTPLQNIISLPGASSSALSAILDVLPHLDDDDARRKVLENRDAVGNTALISAGEQLEQRSWIVGAWSCR
ncbi:BQ2448_1036 [Microbotryum intermedium]|uniref:BQ2448_1036 protein n=1 Tax=Microbotryum intermedium TaxID=269621 RepID=A0A238F6V1_9BASI|nr:BQ2448_1036 [Microbotryum intermedium]